MRQLSVLTFFLSTFLYARTFEQGRVIDVSKTGKTVVINFGSFDGLQEGEMAEFLARPEPGSYDTIYIGKGEVVKVLSNHSYWYLKELVMPELLVHDAKILVSTHRELQSGMRDIKAKRIRVVKGKDQSMAEVLEERRKGTPENLIREEDQYKSTNVDFEENELETLENAEILDIDYLKLAEPRYVDDDDKDLETLYIENYRKGPSEKKVENYAEDLRVETSIDDYISKANQEGLDLEELYKEQEKDPDLQLFRVKHGRFDNRKRKKLTKDQERFIREQALIEIERRGFSWSDEFTDDALRSFIIRKGLKNEFERRKTIYEQRKNHEFFFNFHADMDNQTVAEDPNNRGVGIGYEFGYELPFALFNEHLENFSLGIAYRYSRTSFAIQNINAFIREKAYKLYANWYPFLLPTRVNKFIPYLGAGLRRGAIEASSIFYRRSHKYDLISFPDSYIGLKYRFELGEKRAWGLKAEIHYEINRFRLESSDTSGEVPQLLEVNDLKFAFGASFYY